MRSVGTVTPRSDLRAGEWGAPELLAQVVHAARCLIHGDVFRCEPPALPRGAPLAKLLHADVETPPLEVQGDVATERGLRSPQNLAPPAETRGRK